MAHLVSLVLNQWRPSHRKVVPLAPREAHSTSSCSAPSRTAGCKSWRDFLKAKAQRMRAFWREEQPNGGFPKTWLLQTIIGFPVDNKITLTNFGWFWGAPNLGDLQKVHVNCFFDTVVDSTTSHFESQMNKKNTWSQLYFVFLMIRKVSESRESHGLVPSHRPDPWKHHNPWWFRPEKTTGHFPQFGLSYPEEKCPHIFCQGGNGWYAWCPFHHQIQLSPGYSGDLRCLHMFAIFRVCYFVFCNSNQPFLGCLILTHFPALQVSPRCWRKGCTTWPRPPWSLKTVSLVKVWKDSP